jgi:hypothetical protein
MPEAMPETARLEASVLLLAAEVPMAASAPVPEFEMRLLVEVGELDVLMLDINYKLNGSPDDADSTARFTVKPRAATIAARGTFHRFFRSIDLAQKAED